MSMFLSQQEIKELTGKVRSDAQQTALRIMGIEFKVRPDNKVIISRSHTERELDGLAQINLDSTNSQKNHEPDWEPLNA